MEKSQSVPKLLYLKNLTLHSQDLPKIKKPGKIFLVICDRIISDEINRMAVSFLVTNTVFGIFYCSTKNLTQTHHLFRVKCDLPTKYIGCKIPKTSKIQKVSKNFKNSKSVKLIKNN